MNRLKFKALKKTYFLLIIMKYSKRLRAPNLTYKRRPWVKSPPFIVRTYSILKKPIHTISTYLFKKNIKKFKIKLLYPTLNKNLRSNQRLELPSK